MSLQRLFLIAFIVAFSAAALFAIGVILFSSWNDLQDRILISTISIGGYSLIALCCATVYGHARWKLVSVAGLIACAAGLGFALLTNWRVIDSKLDDLLKGRFAFLTLAMAFGATALMLRMEAAQAIVGLFRGATVIFIWLSALMFEYMIFYVIGSSGEHTLITKLLAASSILALLGLVVTPILRKVSA